MKGSLPPALYQVAQLINDRCYDEADALLTEIEAIPDGPATDKPLTTMILRDRIQARKL